MNASTCAQLYERVDWRSPRLIASFAVLGFINVMVVVGNILVIAAVHQSSKLRSVTNLFIVSLAVADLLVGLAVLPFSSTLEVSKVWIFGDLWCSAWLAVDVWMCTASILNLCAISLDRYVAVTRPVTYPSIMSARRARWLIAAVWVLSFVICFPPLVGWKDKRMADSDMSSPTGGRFGNIAPSLIGGQRTRLLSETATPPSEAATTPVTSTTIAAVTAAYAAAYAVIARNDTDIYTTDSSESSSPTEQPPPCPWICELTNDTGYVIYSALGSFFIPMFVMLFFYWRIYRAAVSTTRAINQGFRTTKGSRRAFGARFDEQRLTLRIHRGRGSVLHGSPSSATSAASAVSVTSATTTTPLSVSPGGRSSDGHKFQRSSARRRECSRTPDKIKISVSYPSSDAICQQDKNGGGGSSAAAVAAAAAAAAVAAAAERCANPGNGSGPTAPGSLSPSTSKKSSFSSASSPTGLGPGGVSGGPGLATLLGNGSARKASTASLSPGSPVSSLTTATPSHRDPCHLRVSGNRLSAFRRRRSSADSDCCAHAHALGVDLSASSRDLSTSPSADEPGSGAGGGAGGGSGGSVVAGGPNRARLISKMGKRNIKAQVKRFRMETKAAKTLAIIVGGFVVCWLPFFTMYLVRAFCPRCIHPTVFSVLFWLGYCNSAINPCIYALFSKDFRFAFKRVICRCLCVGSSGNVGCGGNSGGGGGTCGGGAGNTANPGGGVRRSSQRSSQRSGRRGSEGSQLGLRVLGGADGRVKTASTIDVGSDSR